MRSLFKFEYILNGLRCRCMVAISKTPSPFKIILPATSLEQCYPKSSHTYLMRNVVLSWVVISYSWRPNVMNVCAISWHIIISWYATTLFIRNFVVLSARAAAWPYNSKYAEAEQQQQIWPFRQSSSAAFCLPDPQGGYKGVVLWVVSSDKSPVGITHFAL